ncbi:Nramp family divalent metal transporter [Geobacter sp. DSM 9736]|uniref:Nramp family divalent metal transporter n=1 Tax=Geobacter sp. DSM 9736 TaxID=1277350 RepID=UPI000B506A28|nr:Nramp family divalent metal transporter [Geobacter sp. DSM 9736]SNB46575.1 manganese transport protein [Geobacter sp. DSM 9736]
MQISRLFRLPRHVRAVASDIFRYIGPGLLVTVGFIDPGNWAANVAAGSGFGYSLLWMVSLGTLMLILLQHNAAHLGIVTGYCLSEAATLFLPRPVSRTLLFSGWLASVATALAELLGAAIALQMLTGLPIRLGAFASLLLAIWLILSKSYNRIERLIIGFVSLIGLSFVFELLLVSVDWRSSAAGWVSPSIPPGALPVVMGVLGAVVMPHNLFLHSEIIQSRQWHLQGEEVVVSRLRYEFFDTLFSMIVGWGINSAMIIMAAATFYLRGIEVTDLAQAESMLRPLLGEFAALVFAVALLLAGIASSITAGMAGGSIVAGMYGEPYSSTDPHTRLGVAGTLAAGAALIWTIENPFRGLILSQVFLSIQLPWTILLQIYLTSSSRVMGKHANPPLTVLSLGVTAAIVIILNVMLLLETLRG